MRIRKLELQGYKSFASKTEFAFDSGVTAIVGPNGSGKSNVADAVRWVLGEQSYRLLRGKRTEDMIFSGSSQRSRSGLAQVTLTLDNSEGWLPVEFNEVTISRRALRSGENEYLLNGSRVRLRDISELLGRSGLARRTYTVIGQGLIDAALSLRPDERRGLFEEAAGITVHQMKRSEALSRLDNTQSNLVRINDIIAEIAPRLRTLRSQAKRAENHAKISEELAELLRVWYGYRWYVARNQVDRAHKALSQHAQVVEQRQSAIGEVEKQIADLRTELTALRDTLGEWHRESSKLHAAAEAVERELAVWQERKHQISGQIEGLTQELVALRTEAGAENERIALSETLLAEIETERREQAELAAIVQRELEEQETGRRLLLHSLNNCRDDAFRLATELADRRNRLVQLDERKRELRAKRNEHKKLIEAGQNEIGELERQIRTLTGELETWLEATLLLETEQGKARETAVSIAAARPAIEDQLDQDKEELTRLRSRRDILARLRQDLEGYQAGVRSVIRAKIPGVIGPVAGLISVTPDLERAIETALGGHLQDLVVEKWDIAEKAIAHLQRNKEGRATFLPLDTVRRPNGIAAPHEPGVIGVATELVEFESHLRPVIDMLLGRTVVVDNLKTARGIMKTLRGSFQIVTQAGEIVRSSGAVTGGETRKTREGSMLGREREWRELPDKIQQAKTAMENTQSSLDKNHKAEAQHRQTVEDLARDLARRLDEQTNLEEQIQDLRRKQDRCAQEAEWHQRLIEQLAGENRTLDERKSELETEIEEQTQTQIGVNEQIKELRSQEASLSTEDLQSRLADLRSAIAVLDARRDSQRQTIRSQRNLLQHTRGQIAGKENRTEELQQQREALSVKIADTSIDRADLLAQLAEQEGKIGPAEGRLGELEEQLGLQYTTESRSRQRLREAESRHSQASLELQRQEDQLRNLHRQIEEDLGLVEVETIEGVVEQTPLPLHPLVSKLPVVEQLPDGVEEEINRLRARLRRLGAINPGATEEYTASLERHTFLSEQVADLKQATRSLRAVIAELDEIMERDFMQTFHAIAAQFKTYFATLFVGGSAQLVLTDPNNVSESGIDIIARPPGKRQQGLALLSGGERALTAAALVFAILRISPTPFCILDEVDASLDEVNVERFRQALKDLSDQTQFIVITHNRGTVEIADTIYGITMGEDNTSRSISLHLDGEGIQPA